MFLKQLCESGNHQFLEKRRRFCKLLFPRGRRQDKPHKIWVWIKYIILLASRASFCEKFYHNHVNITHSFQIDQLPSTNTEYWWRLWSVFLWIYWCNLFFYPINKFDLLNLYGHLKKLCHASYIYYIEALSPQNHKPYLTKKLITKKWKVVSSIWKLFWNQENIFPKHKFSKGQFSQEYFLVWPPYLKSMVE